MAETFAEIKARVGIGPCKACGGEMVTQRTYSRNRVVLRELGFLRFDGHGLCARDYVRAKVAGTLPDPAPNAPAAPPIDPSRIKELA